MVKTRSQQRIGYPLIAAGIVVLVLGMMVFRFYNVPPVGYLGFLVPAAILVYLGYNVLSPDGSDVLNKDEGRQLAIIKAGNNAFWWLLFFIYADAVLGFLPADGASFAYFVFGLVVVALQYVYQVYT